MKIIALQAENIKKLVAVEIRPDGNLVQITGKNGQGKTSILDSIWWALAGTSNIQGQPIRKGEKSARIRLDLGEIIVTRTFRDSEKGATSTITVENAEGARFSSPQAMLDGFLSSLSFDPLAFARMKPADQFNLLRGFVPGVDFDQIDQANRVDYARRTDLNRRAKEAKAWADSMQVDEDAPDGLIDTSDLIDQMQSAAAHNAAIETRQARRNAVQDEIHAASKKIDVLKAEILGLSVIIEEKKAALATAPALPAPIDIADLRAKIDKSKILNLSAESKKKQREHYQTAEILDSEANALTATMESRTKAKQAAIAAAKLPVEGIGFGDGIITLNGVPFDQASDAEQLRTSIALAMAANPKLKVLRVRDGSLLDEDSMKILQEMSEANDYQVWIERVDGSGKTGFVLEDGHVTKAQ